MKRSRITIKLFVITSVVFIAFTTVVLILLTLFFEKYYWNKKVGDFIENTRELSVKFNERSIDDSESLELISGFDESNNSETVIFNIRIYTEGVKSSADPESAGIQGAIDTEIADKDKLAAIESVTGKKNIADAKNGIINKKVYFDSIFPYDKMKDDSIVPVITKEWMNNPGYYNRVVNEGQSLVYRSKFRDENNIVCVFPIIKDGRVERAIFSLSSMQPVGEAVSAIKEFYVYIYAAVIIVIMLLSFFYSIMIAKPLINLKNSALKMSELDFTAKCEIKSKDEIGELADILNILSAKLGTTLTELKVSNDKLKEDIEREKQLEIMRKEFVTGVSHELRTPVSLISGYAEALKDNIVKPEDKEFFLDVILDESRHMGHLVNDMLDLSQLETGNFKLNYETFNMVELIEIVTRMFTKNIQDKKVRLETTLPGTSVVVNADMLRIKQVLVNFLSNALKNVPDEGRIGINLEDKTDFALVEITNQGNHIPEDELDKIWERFYKVDKSRNRHTEGTGIGLSIVRNILRLHNSKFGVENTGEGVRFYFQLPKG